MKNINFPMLLLAILVISMFSLAGIAMAYGKFLLIFLFIVLGFLLMGFGIYLKRKSDA